MARIGLMGGTFDPIHNGHLLLARQAHAEYKLHQIWFMPAGQPPHKHDHSITPAADRCAMIRLAIAPFPFFRFFDFEIRREGDSYTAETLRLLHRTYPQHEFYFIVGADSFLEIESWYHPDEILRQTRLLVADREYPGAARSIKEQARYLTERYDAKIQLLHCSEMHVASGELRAMIARQEPISSYVPRAVETYICANGLYTAQKSL
ncbi:MAG: nicotinate-nucleotide adenylyltransferase [Clostridiales bacterium]|nr:nicotinate-nucleotide adenylyltransferase [Clostridiales bacterium]